MWGVEVKLHTFSMEMSGLLHAIIGRVGSRACLDDVLRRKIPVLSLSLYSYKLLQSDSLKSEVKKK